MYKLFLTTIAVVALLVSVPLEAQARPHKHGITHQHKVKHHVKHRIKYKRKKRRARAIPIPLPRPADVSKQEKCFIFFCTPLANSEKTTIVSEAKKWEGKTVVKPIDRRELKQLFTASNRSPVDPARIPWCAAFANAILNRTGYETTGSLQARSFLHWGNVTHNPKDGDIVVLARGRGSVSGHVGFFQGYEWYRGNQYVKVLGGNTSKAVQVGYFPVNKVIGYRTAA